jgi:DNA-binding XRE family transcriptional regulator
MTLQSLKHEALKNKDVKQEYDRLESEFTLIEQLISMRKEAGLTQEQLAQKMQTHKSNISRLEKENSNPSWKTLLKYANVCGFKLSLTLHKKESHISR